MGPTVQFPLLRIDVPEMAEFVYCPSGKFLCWHLGVDSIQKSFTEASRKYVNRVHDVVEGSTPSTTPICRYNNRVVPVLSFASQFACPPPC